MKTVFIILMFIVFLAIATCNNDSKNETVPAMATGTTTSTLPAVVETTTTTIFDFLANQAEIDSLCSEQVVYAADSLQRINASLTTISNVNKELATKFLTASLESVRISIEGVQLCADTLIDDGKDFLASLQETQKNLNSLQESL